MRILEEIGANIVNDISAIINQPVNLMDQTGRIIASTSLERIGTYHVGAKKIIDEKLDCLTIYQDEEYIGSKVGINMPIYFDDKIVGVLGISGAWTQIEPYIPLIKKTTEMQLQNLYLKRKEDIFHKEQKTYLSTFFSLEAFQISQAFLSEGKMHGINMLKPYRCVCMSVRNEIPKAFNRQKILDLLERDVQQLEWIMKEVVSWREDEQIFLFLPCQNDVEVGEFVDQLIGNLEYLKDVQLRIGVDDRAYKGVGLKTGKRNAEKSLKIAMSDKLNHIVFYREMKIGVFLNEISYTTKKEYLKNVFGMMEESEIEKWACILEVFYECEGSINRAADKLFIHKNTLQYQLKKLTSITGYDPRNISNAAFYQNAIWFWESLKE